MGESIYLLYSILRSSIRWKPLLTLHLTKRNRMQPETMHVLSIHQLTGWTQIHNIGSGKGAIAAGTMPAIHKTFENAWTVCLHIKLLLLYHDLPLCPCPWRKCSTFVKEVKFVLSVWISTNGDDYSLTIWKNTTAAWVEAKWWRMLLKHFENVSGAYANLSK